MPIRRNIAALRLSDLQKVAAHAGQADSLGRRRSFVRRRHFLQEKMINPEEDRGGAAIFFGIYHFFLKKMPTTDEGTAPTQAISLTGVRGDLLQIAQAERGYIATNGHCAALDELVSSNSLSLSRGEREGYAYSVECSGGDFTAI